MTLGTSHKMQARSEKHIMVLPLESLEGKYEIVAKIREGGMGAIYKVRHRLLGEVRVVKVLHPQHEQDDELKERFLRDARSAIQLRHPNVVQIFDFSLDPSGTGLLVMEHIAGADWRRLIRGGRRPSVNLTLEMARQALLALGYLHRGGFVHRDVSPDNLMLSLDHDHRPLIKLIDLGIAKSLTAEQLTVTGSFLGKFRYASPEHFGSAGSGGTGPRSDLYTLGLVLYELLTGIYPMEAEDTSQLISAHLFRPPRAFEQTDPEKRLAPEIREMILHALAKKPEQRYQSAQSWVEEIDRLQKKWPLEQDHIVEARQWLAVSADDDESTWKPGSTQSKLDRNFGLEATPRPAVDRTPDDKTRTVLDESTNEKPDNNEPASATPATASAHLAEANENPATTTSAVDLEALEAAGDFVKLFETGVKCVLLRDYERATGFFEAARRLRPDDPRVIYNLERLRRRGD